MSIQTYDIGDEIAVTGTFSTGDPATPTDPASVIVTVKAPDGTRTVLTYSVDPTVQRLSTGVFQYSLLLTQSGDWHYRIAGSGGVNAAEEGTARVRRSLVT